MSRGNRDWQATAMRQAEKQRQNRLKRAARKAAADPVQRITSTTGALVTWYPAGTASTLASAPRPPRADPLQALQFDVWVPKPSVPETPESAPVHLADDDRPIPQPLVHARSDR